VKDKWNFAGATSGLLFVAEGGVTRLLEWYADSWDSQKKV
jgi:hypothetical protein